MSGNADDRSPSSGGEDSAAPPEKGERERIRLARQKMALKANMARRKAQAKARAGAQDIKKE